jgi:hypothetical protein
MEKFINESTLIFSDVSSELKREYNFPNGTKLTIHNPLYLNVSASGGHRLFANNGFCYYIKPSESWFIKWKPKSGQPHFVK